MIEKIFYIKEVVFTKEGEFFLLECKPNVYMKGSISMFQELELNILQREKMVLLKKKYLGKKIKIRYFTIPSCKSYRVINSKRMGFETDKKGVINKIFGKLINRSGMIDCDCFLVDFGDMINIGGMKQYKKGTFFEIEEPIFLMNIISYKKNENK
jgi:hypothetical protein